MSKVVLFLLCIFGITITSAQIVEYLKAGHKCQRELAMERKLADRIVKGNFVERTEKNQCFVKCLYQTFGIIDADGDFIPEIARQKVPKPLGKFKDMAANWVDTCQDEDGIDLCEKAFNIWECFVKLKAKSQSEIIKKLTNS